MRIKRNYLGVVKGASSWIVSRFKPLTVQLETIIIDNIRKGKGE